MTKFRIPDVRSLEDSRTSPKSLKAHFRQIILGSRVARVRVEAINPETGEYRVVLQGTLERNGANEEKH